MGNVVALNHDASFDYGDPDADVVEKLEWLLAEAKSGNLRGLVYGAVSQERSLIFGYTGRTESHCMVAVAAKAFHNVMDADAADWDV